MSADRILMLKLLGDTSSMDRTMRKSEGRMKSFGRTVQRWGTAVVADLAIQGFEKLGDALGDAWTGFREGEKASSQLGTTWKNLGLDGSKLQTTIDAISRSTLKLGTDDTEAIMAFNRAVQTTGGRPAEAMKRLRIAQDLVANGSAPNLNSALKLIQQAGKGSARVVDQFGLKSKTASGRIEELGRKVKGAGKKKADLDPLGVLFNAINEDLEGIVGSLSKGDIEGAIKSLGQIGTDISETWDKIGPSITGVLDKLSGGAWSTFIGTLQDLGEKFLPKIRGGFDRLSEVWDALQPSVQAALDAIQPLVDLLGNAASGTLGFVLDSVNGVLGTIASLLKGDFSSAFTTAGETAGKLAEGLNTMFLGLPDKFLNEWIPEIAQSAADLGGSIVTSAMTFISTLPDKVWDALTGEESIVTKLGDAVLSVGEASAKVGSAIFDGIVGALAGLAEAIAKPVRDGLNAIIDAWNSSNQIHVPEIVIFSELGRRDTLGPFDVGFPDIPRLAKGGIATRPTLAMIGEAGPEAVVPLGRGGGMGSTYNITVNVAPGGDLVEAGRQMVRAITSFERRSGRVWRSA